MPTALEQFTAVNVTVEPVFGTTQCFVSCASVDPILQGPTVLGPTRMTSLLLGIQKRLWTIPATASSRAVLYFSMVQTEKDFLSYLYSTFVPTATDRLMTQKKLLQD